ncbi:MAG: DNA/RNA nuclease SfsA [Calditrichia bacterium]|nr:DNA/RNA nuclease SfsA [Calditrichia bacterium]
MIFKQTLIPGKLIQRYKRFLADIELDTGKIITAHCPNSGSMKTCANPGWQVMLSESDNPKRKYKYTWEMVHNGKCWIGVNTIIPNIITEEALLNESIPELKGYDEVKREVKYGTNSRIDILLKSENQLCYVEVKNVTLVEDDGNYYFPDSETSRGLKHLHELIEMKSQDHRSVMLFVIQRNDGEIFKPAAHIDPKYAEGLKNAYENGVEILVRQADVTPTEINLIKKIPWQF